MAETIEFKWKRPVLGYPKVWSTFEARDIDSNDLVEYRVQDLPESRFEEALDIMAATFCKDEPVCEAYDIINDPVIVEDYKRMWRPVIRQKCVLACFKEGSDEIIGLNMNFVTIKDEHFFESIREEFKIEKTLMLCDIFAILYENFDTCEYYRVDKYLCSVGLMVSGKYRGRGIGGEILKTRRIFCKEFDIELTSTLFTSNFSNKIADQVGFELVKSIRYDDIRTNYPRFNLPPMKSNEITIKTIIF